MGNPNQASTALAQRNGGENGALTMPHVDISVGGGKPMGLVPQSITEMMILAEGFANSGMFGQKTPQAALTILMTGAELGLKPAQSMRAIHVIEGKPTLSADAMVAICQNAPGVCAYFICLHTDAEYAEYETKRVGDPHPQSLRFSYGDAERAKLTNKDNWQKYPAAMLRARAASGLARMVYRDLLLGLMTDDESRAIAEAERESSVRRHGDAGATFLTNALTNTVIDAEFVEPELILARKDVAAAIKTLSAEQTGVAKERFKAAFGMAAIGKLANVEDCIRAKDIVADIARGGDDDPFAEDEDELVGTEAAVVASGAAMEPIDADIAAAERTDDELRTDAQAAIDKLNAAHQISVLTDVRKTFSLAKDCPVFEMPRAALESLIAKAAKQPPAVSMREAQEQKAAVTA